MSCPSCALTYPIRGGIPILLTEEASSTTESSPFTTEDEVGESAEKVRFLAVEGSNKGDVIELANGTCRALGRSLEDAEKTRVFSVGSTVSLDEFSKKLVMNYIAKQFHKTAPASGEGESFGAFRRLPDFNLRDKAISRLHAMIFYDESGVGVLDLVSKNGTFVNGVEVESKLLKKGDLVSLGATKLRLET